MTSKNELNSVLVTALRLCDFTELISAIEKGPSMPKLIDDDSL